MPGLDRLRRKAAGLLVVRLGSNMPPPRRAEDDAPRVARLLERLPLGGLILFNGRWPETRDTLLALQELALAAPDPRPLLVMADMERGAGQPLAGATLFPHARAFAALGADAEREVEAFARASAREALAAGLHVSFSPVADVNRNPANPIIATRAFGDDPATAARLAAAYVRGCRAEGLLSTAKHFPGHGNTHEDSHATLPVVHDEADVLEALDLPPFRAAFEAGCELVMTAHVAYPALDPSGRPATLSRPILTDLLRGRLGFDGAVVSDSLHMAGLFATGGTEPELAVAQLAAGVDLLLDPQDPEAIVEAVARAVTEGALPEARLDEALARAQRLRDRIEARFGPEVWRDPARAVPPEEVGRDAHRWMATRVARAAVGIEGAVPFSQGEGVLAVLVRPHASPLDPPEQPLGDALREALPGITYREVGAGTPPEHRERLLHEAAGARAVLLALVVKPSAWHAFGLPDDLAAFARRLVEGRPAAVAALGSPRALDGFETVSARIVTYSDAPVAQHALADVLAGRTA